MKTEYPALQGGDERSGQGSTLTLGCLALVKTLRLRFLEPWLLSVAKTAALQALGSWCEGS